MTQEEAIHVLKTIKEVYPKYDICKKKASMLIQELLPMEYPLVLKELAKHVAAYPYPPTISEIAVYPQKRANQIEKLTKWREQAKDVPLELRETFHKQMLELIRGQSYEHD